MPEANAGATPRPPRNIPTHSSAATVFETDREKLRRLKADIALLPEGRALLDFARRQRVSIVFATEKELEGDIGETRPPRNILDSPRLALRRDASHEQLVPILLHELRHARQQRLLQKNGVYVWSIREQAFFGRLIECDAFTFQTVSALQLKKLGRPEFFDGLDDAATIEISKFLKRHPPESFADEQAFARGLFTHLALHPLKPYTDSYLDYMKSWAPWTPDENQKGIPLGKLTGSGLEALYGPDFIDGLSMRALKAGMLQTWSAWDRATIRAAEKMQLTSEGVSDEEAQKREHYLALRLKFRNSSAQVRAKKMAGKSFEHYRSGAASGGPRTGLIERYAAAHLPPPAAGKTRKKRSAARKPA